MRKLIFGLLILLSSIGVSEAQDSLNMSLVSRIDYWQDVDDIQIVGNVAYVLLSRSGLHILDLTDGTHPVEIGRYLFSADNYSFGGMHVSGNLAYLALGGGIIVLDISDPTHPLAVNEPYGEYFCDILVHDGFAIANDVSGDLSHPVFLNVSNPDSIYPVLVEAPNFYRSSVLIGMAGDYFCVFKNTAEGNMFSLLKLDSAQQLQLVSEFNTGFYVAYGMIAGNYAYLASNSFGTSIVDLSNPQEPVLAGHVNCGSYSGLDVVEGRAMIARNDTTLDIWNVNDPATAFLEGSCFIHHRFYRVAAKETNVYLGCSDGDSSIVVVDLAQPSAPSVTGGYGTRGFPNQLTTSGTIAYIADLSYAVRTIDLADPAHVLELGRGHQYSGAYDIAVNQNRAYLANTHGFIVYDVSLPAQPEPLSHRSFSCYEPNIALYGDYVYSFGNLEGIVSGYLHVYSLQDTALPVCVDSIWSAEMLTCFTVTNDYLYLVSGNNTLKIFSLADPALPVEVGSIEIPVERITDLAVEVGHIYVSTAGEAVYVVDTTVPSVPTLGARIQESANCLAVRGNLLAIHTQQGLKLMDVTDPTHALSLGFYASTDDVRDMQFYDSYLLTVSTAQFGVYLFDSLAGVRPQTESVVRDYELHSCYPNPFNPTTQVSFDLPKSDHVSLKVFDILGREIATLVNGKMISGAHTVRFDGTDLSSGIYLYRLQTGAFNKTSKMILLK